MPSAEPQHVRQVAISAARAAGGLLRERSGSIREIRHKSAIDIVTDVDVQSEQQISAMLLGAFPGHTILGEEGGARPGSDPRYRWIIDPIDGTTNYAHGLPLFCVSIGFEVEGQPQLGVVYAPMQDELFVAEAGAGATLNDRPIQVSTTADLGLALMATGFPYDRNDFPRALHSFEVVSLKTQAVRRIGSAALDLCYVACGRLDGYWEHVVRPWDLAAGVLLVKEAGGQVTATDGSAFSIYGGQVLASNGVLHRGLTETLAGL